MKAASLIALGAHYPPSYHLFFEILALFYFIKPYRMYWKKKFGRTEKVAKSSEEGKKEGEEKKSSEVDSQDVGNVAQSLHPYPHPELKKLKQ